MSSESVLTRMNRNSDNISKCAVSLGGRFSVGRMAESTGETVWHHGVPSAWLIDREGKLISYQARGTTLWQLVAEAVKDDSTD